MFPNILNFLSNDPATPWLHYAVVLNGKLQATNNKIACYIDVSTFCESEEQIKAIEGKVFSRRDIAVFIEPVGDISKSIIGNEKKINFESKGIIISNGKILQHKEYTGIIGQNREIALYDDLMDDYNLARGFKKFPDFSTIIPAITDNEIDVVKVQKRNTHFRGVGVGVSQMVDIAAAFQQSKEGLNNLRFEFFHAAKDKDKVDKPSAPILITPFKSKFELYKEAAIINPVL